MSKRAAALAATLILWGVTYGLLLTYFTMHEKRAPVASQGAIDLSSWRFAEHGVVPLDGEWEFYPAGSQTPTMIRVPGSWSGAMKPLGMAAYRLQVRIGDKAAVYGVKTGSIQLSNRLLVNGETVGASGNPGEKGSYRAQNKPYVSYFTLQPGWNELLVQVANYDFSASSGINDTIFLGTVEQISGLRDKALAHDWITITAFLIMGLYFVGLYSQRNNDRSLLVFGLMCVSIAVFTSARGERVLLDVFGDVPFWLFFRIQMVSAVGSGFGFFLYVYTAFRPYCSRRLYLGSLVVGLAIALAYIGFATEMPTALSALLRQLTTLYVTFSLFYATYLFVLAALHQAEGSRYLIAAATALNVLALKQNVNIYFGVPTYALAPFEPFLVLLMLALLMSLRFSNAFRQIEELSVQLLQADKWKDDFLARTSHEFKTPLHGVIQISRSMLDEETHPPNAEQREKLQLVIDIAGRLSRLVYDIMDLSKLKQGELRIVPVPIDVRSAVEVQVRLYAYLCAERNIRLVNRIPAHLPAALADESRISQIIGNLLDNAVKHTRNGSIVIGGAERDGLIEISVRDTGEGIEPHDMPFIFEPFKTLDGSQRGSFGLGLSIAKQLVELQNGTLAAASERGAGSTFTFTLPIADRAGDAGAAHPDIRIVPKGSEFSFPTPYETNRGGKHTVLIVDDQFVNLKVLADALQALDYRVIAVKNGYEALEQIDRPGKLDLVILDLMMPGMSGYEVCQEIRRRYSLLELPVLMVTAVEPQDKAAAFQAGANDYLPKPFDPKELKARIGSLLALKDSLGKAVHLEVAFLQSQIKPHFLYNVLNSIVASSYTDVERARKTIVDLADYLRGSFRFSNTEERIPMREELQLIRTYVSIEQARFKNRIRFESDIAEAALGLRIPPLLLQPLVENAIRHGIGDRIAGGTVNVTASEEEGQWKVVVADDGVGIGPERLNKLLARSGELEPQGVGLLNIDKRLKHEYGVRLEVESEPGRGTKVTVRIPASSV